MTDMPGHSSRQLIAEDGEAWLYERFYEQAEATENLESLRETIEWRQDAMKMYGKELLLPRLTASFGEMYVYSGIRHPASDVPPILARMLADVQQSTGYSFNSILLNYYRHGNDRMGWHSDAEKSLGANPAVASISLGQPRPFQFRHRGSGKLLTVVLEHGSMLLMAGKLQHYWMHQLPKRTWAKGPRINITFRNVVH